MDNLKAELQTALKAAMKAKDRPRRSALRLLQSAIKQVEIDSQSQLDDSAIRDILQKEAKMRRESIAELEAAGRTADARAAQFELTVIEGFLPRQLTAAELKAIVAAAIRQSGATSPQQMGQVMGQVMPQVAGLADGRQVAALVKELLS